MYVGHILFVNVFTDLADLFLSYFIGRRQTWVLYSSLANDFDFSVSSGFFFVLVVVVVVFLFLLIKEVFRNSGKLLSAFFDLVI